MHFLSLRFKKNSISRTLFFISVFLFPIDSFPIFPTDNEYRPISFFFLLPIFFIYLTNLRLKKHDIIVVFLILIISLQTLIASIIILNEFGHIPKVFITLGILEITSISFYYIISIELKKDFSVFLHKLGQVCSWSLILIFVISFIQLISILGILPVSLSEKITGIFSYRSVNRIQGISGEPSWMVRYLCLFGVISFFYYKGKWKSLINFLTIFFLLLSGSTYGYLVVLISVLVYFVFFRFGFKLILLFSFLTLTFFLITKFLNNYEGNNYTLKRLSNVTSIISNPENLIFVLEKDGSMFQRIVNPVIGFKSGEYSCYFGLGLDGYRYIYPDVINRDYSYALRFDTVSAAAYGSSYITPKSLYSKIYSELGVPFFLFFLIMILLIIKKIKSIRFISNHEYFFLAALFSISFVSILNTDSIINQSFIFSIYLCTMISNKIKNDFNYNPSS